MNFFSLVGGTQSHVLTVICKKGSHLQKMFNFKKFASKKFKKERGVVGIILSLPFLNRRGDSLGEIFLKLV